MSRFTNNIKRLINKYSEGMEAIEKGKQDLKDSNAKYSDIYINNKLKELEGDEEVLRDYTLKEYEKNKETFLKDLEEWTTPKGADLNTDDLSLLNGYVDLTQEELIKLGEKHRTNYTMIRALREYANKKELVFHIVCDDEDLLREFDIIDQFVRGAISDHNSYSGMFLRDTDHLDKVSKHFSIID